MPKRDDMAKHQPSKAELEEDVSIDATPEELARAVMGFGRTTRRDAELRETQEELRREGREID